MEYTTLNIEEEKHFITVWLNRPKVHNAINGEMIHELLYFFNEIACNQQARVVVIRGKGKSFCAGADLNWMKKVLNYTYDQNYLDSLTLAKCLYAMNVCPKVVISVVHGAVMGGANGLAAASDIVVSTDDAQFAMSETSLGLVPAIISPYVIDKIGKSHARRLMLMATKFDAVEAERIGLVHYVVSEGELDNKVEEIINQVLKNSPDAIRRTKQLLEKISMLNNPDELMKYTSETIAKARISEEGQEGIAAFFSKQKPGWVAQTEKKENHLN